MRTVADYFGNQFSPGMQQGPQSQREFGLGSGVIVNPDGYILTNNHVVSGALDVEVLTPDQRQFKAKGIGSDPLTDVAVIKIEATGLPTLPLGITRISFRPTRRSTPGIPGVR